MYGSILTYRVGSQYFDVHHNLFLYGTGGLKSDYGGHDNRHHENVYAWLAHGKAVSVEASAHASRPVRCWRLLDLF